MTKPLVLIVEDDPKLVLIYQMTLQQIGFDTVLDTGGDQCLPMLATIHPVLIVLDLHMPFANGVDILHHIRRDPSLSDVPVIVTTADLVLAKSIQDQADAILIKPVSVSRLRETALRLLPAHVQNELQDQVDG